MAYLEKCNHHNSQKIHKENIDKGHCVTYTEIQCYLLHWGRFCSDIFVIFGTRLYDTQERRKNAKSIKEFKKIIL